MLFRKVAEPKLLIPAPKPQGGHATGGAQGVVGDAAVDDRQRAVAADPAAIGAPGSRIADGVATDLRVGRVIVASGAFATSPPSGPNPATPPVAVLSISRLVLTVVVPATMPPPQMVWERGVGQSASARSPLMVSLFSVRMPALLTARMREVGSGRGAGDGRAAAVDGDVTGDDGQTVEGVVARHQDVCAPAGQVEGIGADGAVGGVDRADQRGDRAGHLDGVHPAPVAPRRQPAPWPPGR